MLLTLLLRTNRILELNRSAANSNHRYHIVVRVVLSSGDGYMRRRPVHRSHIKNKPTLTHEEARPAPTSTSLHPLLQLCDIDRLSTINLIVTKLKRGIQYTPYLLANASNTARTCLQYQHNL